MPGAHPRWSALFAQPIQPNGLFTGRGPQLAGATGRSPCGEAVPALLTGPHPEHDVAS